MATEFGHVANRAYEDQAGNPTPVAATTFGKKVNWVALGT